MAQALTYKRTTTDKLTIKGLLSDDATIVTIKVKENDKEVDKEITIKDYFDNFAGEMVEISIGNKTEENLVDSPTSEE